MKKFNYSGPVTTLTIDPAKFKEDGSIKTRAKEKELFPGKSYSLPEDNLMVKNLIALKLLKEDQSAKPPVKGGEATE